MDILLMACLLLHISGFHIASSAEQSFFDSYRFNDWPAIKGDFGVEYDVDDFVGDDGCQEGYGVHWDGARI